MVSSWKIAEVSMGMCQHYKFRIRADRYYCNINCHLRLICEISVVAHWTPGKTVDQQDVKWAIDDPRRY